MQCLSFLYFRCQYYYAEVCDVYMFRHHSQTESYRDSSNFIHYVRLTSEVIQGHQKSSKSTLCHI